MLQLEFMCCLVHCIPTACQTSRLELGGFPQELGSGAAAKAGKVQNLRKLCYEPGANCQHFELVCPEARGLCGSVAVIPGQASLEFLCKTCLLNGGLQSLRISKAFGFCGGCQNGCRDRLVNKKNLIVSSAALKRSLAC